MKCILDGSTAVTALSLPAPVKSVSTSESTGIYEFKDQKANSAVTATLFFGGTDAADEMYKYRVDLAFRVENSGAGCYVWTPVASGDITLGAASYDLSDSDSAPLGVDGSLWADTIVDALGSERSLTFSPANDEVARLVLDVRGAVALKVTTQRISVIAADVFCQLDDHAVATIVATKASTPIIGGATTATTTITGTPTVTETQTRSKTITATDTGTSTDTLTKSPTTSGTKTMTATATATLTKSDTSSGSATFTQSTTKSLTKSDTVSKTQTVTQTETGTATAPKPTFTATDTLTKTDTATDTKTPTATVTQTQTKSDTFTKSATITATDTKTATATDTLSKSVTVSKTKTATDTATQSATVTMTADSS